MANKKTYVTNVFMNGDDISKVRTDLDQPTWEWGIDLQIKNLTQVAPFTTSRAVLAQLANSGHYALIVPAHPGEPEQADPVKGIDWPDTTRPDWLNSTPQDTPPLYCAEGAIGGRDKTGTPLPMGGKKGTGAGSSAVLYFTSQDHCRTLSLPGGRPDEILLHELVHALRMAKGVSLCVFMGDDYDTLEEFYAILIANIYRSECGYSTIRANHFGKQPLKPPLTDDMRFYRQYKSEIDRLLQQMPLLCRGIATVVCRFNPIRRALVN